MAGDDDDTTVETSGGRRMRSFAPVSVVRKQVGAQTKAGPDYNR